MRRLRNAAVGILVTAALSVPYTASSQDQAGSPASDARPSFREAPVLCIWEQLMATQLVGEKCHPGEDAALQNELASSVHRVDAFIMANDATATPDKVEAFKKQFRDQSLSQDLCANPDAKGMYADAKSAGPEGMRSDTDQLIAVPRKPVRDGC